MGCAQVLTIVLNAFNIIKGLGLIGLGITLAIFLQGLFVFTAYTGTVTSVLGVATGIVFFLAANSAAFLIGIGCLVLFLAIWGIVAAAKKHRTLLTIGLVFLFVLLAFEIFVTSVSGVYAAEKTSNLTQENFDNDANLYQSTVEDQFRCCGIAGPEDYTTAGRPVPESCKDVNGVVYQDGCGQYRGDLTSTDWIYVGVLIGLTTLTLLTVVCTLALCASSGKDDYDY